MVTPKKFQDSIYSFDDLTVDRENFRLFKGGQSLSITPRAFDVLVYLIEHRGRVVEKSELFEQIWKEAYVTDNALTKVIKEIRQTIGDEASAPRYIETIPKRGYRFIADVGLEEEKGFKTTAAPTVLENAQHLSSDLPSAQAKPLINDDVAAPPTKTHPWLGKRKLIGMAISLGIIAIAALVIWKMKAKTAWSDWPVVTGKAQITFSPSIDSYPTFSPDGNSIAYSSDQSGSVEIYSKQLTPGAREIQLTNDGKQNFQPVWSPDGKMIAYHSKERGGIWVMPAFGGVPRQLSEFGSWPAWSPDSSQIAFQSGALTDLSASAIDVLPPSTVWIVSLRGGAPIQLTKAGTPKGGHGSPTWSPDGQRIVFLVSDNKTSEMWMMSAKGENLKQLTDGHVFHRNPVFAPDGQSIYFTIGGVGNKDQALMEVAFSLSTGELSGEPMMVLDTGAMVSRNLTVSRDGKKIAYSLVSSKSNLWSVPLVPETGAASGSPVPMTQDTSIRNLFPSFSADGKRIAYGVWRHGTKSSIWVMDADGKNHTQMTNELSYDNFPFWLPQGNRIAFLSAREGKYALWSIELENGSEKILREININMTFPRFSPDGKEVIFNSNAGAAPNVWKASIEGGEPKQLTFDQESAGYACWSPDGKMIAFQIKRGDDTHIAVMPSSGGEVTQLTFDRGQSWAHSWSPDGDKIAFAGFRNGYWNIWWVSQSTKAQKQVTNYSKLNSYVRYPAWSPSGNQIVYEYAETNSNIWMLELK
ncbi:MAG TPA: winged helix-turn-helix domain-containing protein [Blastocatellia bacterium]|nr:winged helix-turn-helix domain-containing protein [Blastocatellia bacterium]